VALSFLTLLVVLAIAGPGTLRPAFVAAAAFVVVPSYIRNATFIDFLPVLFGLSAIGVALFSGWARRRRGVPAQLEGATRIAIDRSRSRVTERVDLASAGRGRS
jgi:ABC-type branched-subunit amino acid transport system permease subunit